VTSIVSQFYIRGIGVLDLANAGFEEHLYLPSSFYSSVANKVGKAKPPG
jgi:hypothetical protein